ncbi:hypothetical protein BGX23_010045 [Mortierella sp. AD031]|nr:hypothetical protein BGX23_010045 [Mortierella sp. AD031]KAG0201468.1 hypothetical protein BGX33_010310 [Mortierella sp. NVP41]
MATPTSQKPHILIVGAGLGGLMLGALFEKSGVPYTIFERAAVVKPLGSAMSIGPELLPVFRQLGIYDDFVAVSKPLLKLECFKGSLEPYRPFDYSLSEEMAGHGYYIVSRPALLDLFLKQVPVHKIHFGKRVQTISEKDDKVRIQIVNEETIYEGDILVGADGAYSAVRQRLYETLMKEGKLPKSDQEDLPFNSTCVVGQTTPLDPEEFPILKEPNCCFRYVIGEDRPFTWVIFTTAQNALSWMVIHHLNERTSKAAMEKKSSEDENTAWGPYAAQAMCDETRSFPIPIGDGKITLGDLYDRTPKNLVSKVSLEEKVFKTWHHGRTVLLGDACHKLNPSGGQGAMVAIHDAIALANLLYALPSTTSNEITRIFEEYQTERYPAVVRSFDESQLGSKMTEKGIVGALTLYMFTHMPTWLWNKFLVYTLKFRPLAGFLEPIENKGTVIPIVSPSYEKARAVYEQRMKSGWL